MPQAFDPRKAVLRFRRCLPHMRQEGAVYYVTFRLGDSVPQEKVRQWHAEKAQFISDGGDSEQALNHVQRQIERWLDKGLGECVLEQPEVGSVVENSLLHFDADRYLLDEYVVMPNHVHVLVHPLADHELSDIVQSWKGFTAHEINKMLGRTGEFWQHEPFDHIVRDTPALMRFREYIRGNPRKLPSRRAISGRGQFAAITGL